MTGTDAVFQETAILRSKFGGKELILFPFLKASSALPRFLYGWNKVLQLTRLQNEISINHIFSPGLYYYPILKFLKKPIVYSVTAAIQDVHLLGNLDRFTDLDRIILNNERDFNKLSSKGFTNVSMIRPAIEAGSLKKHTLPFDSEFVLLMASAPWEVSQFSSKGVKLLLETCSKIPSLKLILLWRGRLLNELNRLISHFNVSERVEVINERVDIQNVMKRANATVLVAESPELVKSYPHSLLESLACAKPVIISSNIAMADYIHDNECGVVMEEFNFEGFSKALQILKVGYIQYCLNAGRIGINDFTIDRMVEEYKGVYQGLINDI